MITLTLTNSLAVMIILHLFGDYVLQSEWMAENKMKNWWPAIVHGITYTLPFMIITQVWWALLIIGGTHVIIDHYRLARYVVWARNQLAPKYYRYPVWWIQVDDHNGARHQREVGHDRWLYSWLMIIIDNTIHLILNATVILWVAS